NQIKTGTIGHAYLFTGARGTGKTSAAKIFAKAVNCLNPVSGSPCGECAVCKALSDVSNLDILEIDAASNNGVDEIRDLREKIKYPPVSGKYKVYIVDEVHMLSTAAFNALLKTLEEPPRHAIFILATTEVQKLPDTILSRCMRFDFRLLPEELIAKHLEDIFAEVGKDAETSAVRAIASAGEGSMRDALSVADMCLSYSQEKLTYSDVLDILGAVDRTVLTELIDDMLGGNLKDVLDKIDKTVNSGRSITVLVKDLAVMLRNVIVLKSDANKKFALPDNVCSNLRIIANKYETSAVLRALEKINELTAELRYSTSPRLLLEATVVKISDARADLNVDGLLTRITMLEGKIAELGSKLEKIESGAVAIAVKGGENSRVQAVPDIVPDDMGGDSRRIWARFVKFLRDSGMFALYQGALSVKETEIENGIFSVVVEDNTNYSILSSNQNVVEIGKLLTKLTGVEYKFKCKLPEGMTEAQSGDIDRLKSLISEDKLNIIK
ncbi:MAG: DNA polymerase III subunit gamma/tau, partial [Clostridia bacterium]|nr:DNA polymerase III subunit gamma/tau [Clostridia bacterium]